MSNILTATMARTRSGYPSLYMLYIPEHSVSMVRASWSGKSPIEHITELRNLDIMIQTNFLVGRVPCGLKKVGSPELNKYGRCGKTGQCPQSYLR